jgi:inhibitor of KinA
LVYKPFGNRAVLVEWPQKIDAKIQEDVWFFKNLIEQKCIKSILEVISAYNSITIIYKSTIDNVYSEISALKSLYKGENSVVVRDTKLWEVPVCYHPDLAPDLHSLSASKNLTLEQIESLHTEPKYTVSFIGFLPGFLYLSGLNDLLYTPRKSSPAKQITAGSVAIGDYQTGIYPMNSPGGWHIIGNSPLNFFDVNSKNPCFAAPGDGIKFVSVSIEEYHEIKRKVADKAYLINYQMSND